MLFKLVDSVFRQRVIPDQLALKRSCPRAKETDLLLIYSSKSASLCALDIRLRVELQHSLFYSHFLKHSLSCRLFVFSNASLEELRSSSLFLKVLVRIKSFLNNRDDFLKWLFYQNEIPKLVPPHSPGYSRTYKISTQKAIMWGKWAWWSKILRH